MLGGEQEAWLDGELGASSATWNVLAQQVVMAALPFVDGDEPLYNLDQWDGYPAARQRLLDVIARQRRSQVE
jgi:alkaline phosphatase D